MLDKQSYITNKFILIVTQNLPVPYDKRVWFEAKSLQEVGHDVSIICPKGFQLIKSYEMIDNISIYRFSVNSSSKTIYSHIKEYFISLFRIFLTILKIAKKQPIDILQFCTPPDLLFIFGFWCKYIYKSKIVFDHHDLNPELFEVKYGGKIYFKWLMNTIEYFAFKVADVIISPNESYKEIAIKRGNHEVENIFIVRNSIYCRNLHENMIKSNKKITIGYLGEIDKHDGLALLVYALDFLVKENKGIKFICSIIGDGPELINIKHLIEKLKLDIYFTFHGRLWGDDLSQQLNEFDIGVVPDSDNEFNQLSTMGKIFEYMSYSIPMVQFDLKENHRISEGAALFADPDNSTDFGEKLYQLISNTALRIKLGSHALHKIRHDFCWEDQEKNLLNAYQRVINI